MKGAVPLEDELGDVVEKALKLRGWREDELAARTGIEVNRIKDALDYRYDFSSEELAALARELRLNEVGLRALAEGRYPQPEAAGLAFGLHRLAMPYGVGVVNAYLLRHRNDRDAVLVDSGSCSRALLAAWPEEVEHLQAHFVTHWDSDHAGGCRDTMARFGLSYCLGPGPERDFVRVMRDQEVVESGGFRVQALSTPGPASEHHCYLVEWTGCRRSCRVLFSGDLFFCGSIGNDFCARTAVRDHARRLWNTLPGDTIVAPGHGPLTTVENEREFNPFASS
jgi:glyoxylase-like metal-dependent hydrolase (beta-lactamase superfamily II)